MENKKNHSLLFVARNFPPNIGGLETLNYETYVNLKKKCKVTLIKNTKHRYSILFLLKGLLLSLMSKEKTVFLSDALLSLYIPFLKLQKRKVVIRVNGLDITGPNILYQLIIPRLTNLADVVVSISKATADQCITRGINPKKIEIVPPGIVSDKYYQATINKIEALTSLLKVDKKELKDKKILLSIGRLVERKGIYWFIKEVFSKLPLNTIYVVAGSGNEFKLIKEYVNKHNLSRRIFLLGEISEKEKTILLNISNLFIMPNINISNNIEGFGISILEASTAGLFSIASDIDGMKDAIHNDKNGFLIIPTKKNFINSINYYLNNNQKIAKRQLIKKTIKENFSWELIANRYLNILFGTNK